MSYLHQARGILLTDVLSRAPADPPPLTIWRLARIVAIATVAILLVAHVVLDVLP